MMWYSLNIKKSNIELVISITQILLLITYLGINIINTGGMGTALPVLAGFFVLSILLVGIQASRARITLAIHFFVFLLCVAWLSFRIVIDLGDFYHLKQLTIGTTGGVLLFFLIGTFLRQSIDIVIRSKTSIRIILIYILLFSVFVFFSFKSRLIRTDIFYIEGVDGGYQRPGNFMTMNRPVF